VCARARTTHTLRCSRPPSLRPSLGALTGHARAGNKFAVASGAKSVPICYFEQKNDWWVSKVIKKHKSTVLSVAWSPNSAFVVTGSCDRKVRVFSTHIAGVDKT
jgi:WD40 repeat protein